jgi:hypothetical protein
MSHIFLDPFLILFSLSSEGKVFSMEDRNGGAIIAIGGLLTIVFLGIWVLRFLRGLFIELGKTFDAFGNMAASGLSMLGNVALAAFLIALIIGSVVAAVYFTYKYIMIVKRATEIKELVERRLHESACELDAAFQEFRSEVSGQIRRMDLQLTEALKEPDPVPLLPVAQRESAEVTPTNEVPATSNVNVEAPSQSAADAEPPVSQPY